MLQLVEVGLSQPLSSDSTAHEKQSLQAVESVEIAHAFISDFVVGFISDILTQVQELQATPSSLEKVLDPHLCDGV